MGEVRHVGRVRPVGLIWLRELRAPFFTASAVPALFGGAYAHWAGAPFNWVRFGLAALGAVLAHAGCNMANDYFDHKSGNDLLTKATPFSGGSKVIQEGLLRPAQVLAASIICLVLATLIGLYLNAVTGGRAILVVGLIGIIIALFYSAPPLKLGHRGGMGELACVIGCGPVIVFGAYFVQSQTFSWPALLAGLPIGVLMGMVLFVNEFHDTKADAAVGKRTLVVMLGTKASVYVLDVSFAAAYTLAVVLVLNHMLAPASLLALATLPIAMYASVRAHRFHEDLPRLRPANAAVIITHALFGITLTLTAAL
jgi:1,4-dihydroxy-2-naphthoate octaprenyltransferase